jgi:hypothetical protein
MDVIRCHLLAAFCCTVFACSMATAAPEERTIRVTVKDHNGKPLKDVRIFPLEDKKAIHLASGFATDGEKEDKTKTYFATDADGRAQVVINKEPRLALTHKTLHGWAVAVTDDDKLDVTLPQAATVEVIYDIKGNKKAGGLFYQWLTHEDKTLIGVGVQTRTELKPGKTVFTLPPGPYQFCRQKVLRQPTMHRHQFVDRQRVVLKAGKTHQVNFVRKTGAPIIGVVVLPEDYESILVYIKPRLDDDDPRKKADALFHNTSYDALRAGEYDKKNKLLGREGSFITETLLPGTYVVEAHGYKPKPPDQGFRSGFVRADQIKKRVVEIPDEGKPEEITINFDPK